MSPLNAAMVILSIICSSLSICSADPDLSSKNFNLHGKKLIVGKHQVDKTTLVYALCESQFHQQLVSCKLKFYSDVLNDGAQRFSCDLDFMTSELNGILEVLEVYLWRPNYVIVTWQERARDASRYGKVGFSTVLLRNSGCRVKEFRLRSYHREDMKPQLFVLPSYSSYDVIYMDIDKCRDHFCKVTVGEDNQLSQVKKWIPNTGLAHAVENLDDHSNKLLVSVSNSGVSELYLLIGNRHKKLGAYGGSIGWSTSSGSTSLCTYAFCVTYSQNYGSKKTKAINLSSKPTYYAALFNLPGNGHLALICDNSQNNYQIIEINSIAHRGYSYFMRELQCLQKPKTMISKFFMESNGQYCLSLFYILPNNDNLATFAKYCFSL